MTILRGSIEANVPLQFADREWSEFVFESLYGNYAKGFADSASLIDETDIDAGGVTFETEGDHLVRISVAVEYTPHSTVDAEKEIALAQANLERDLEKYRTFLLKRCEQESCR